MSRKKDMPWIVADFSGGKTGKCLRCGDELKVGLPVRIEVWLAAMKAFVKCHRECKEHPEEPK